MNDSKLNECADYFRSTPGFKRLFEGIREKYRSLGTFGGSVLIQNLSKDEKDALSGFLKKDYFSKKSASIKVEDVIKALQGTRFEGVELEKVLKEYFNEDLISKKEEKNLYELERMDFFNKIIQSYRDSIGSRWLSKVLESRSGAYRMICLLYDRKKKSLLKSLETVMEGLNSLSFNSKCPERLPIFASRVTKNPHAFDLSTDSGKLFIYGICFAAGAPYPGNAEERAELLYRAGIITDEVSNYTTAYGVKGYNSGVEHNGWRDFFERGEPLQLSLWNISKVDRIESCEGRAYVFENPAVFSEVLYETSGNKLSLVCTSGQIKLASLILLDRLVESGSIVYYSGDFDPEGILIADRLKERYGDKLVLWHYSREDYLISKSKEKIQKERMKKLEKVKNHELRELSEFVIQHGFAGYQELLTDEYIASMLTF